MRFKLSTAAAAATALLGLAALGAPAMAANVIYQNNVLTSGSSDYIEAVGGTSFAVKPGATYYIDFTVPANLSLLTIYTNVVHNIPGLGPVEDYNADMFQLYNGTATACGSNVCGVGSLISPIPGGIIASLNAKIYDLPFSTTPENFALEVVSTAKGKLNGSIQVGAVPEPATWAMTIVGIGLIGLAARRRRETLAVA